MPKKEKEEEDEDHREKRGLKFALYSVLMEVSLEFELGELPL